MPKNKQKNKNKTKQPSEPKAQVKSIPNTFEPGLLVKMKNIISKPELNGKITVITMKKLENGRIPVMGNTENSLAFKPENLELVNECPNEEYCTDKGLMIWPHISKVAAAPIKWLNEVHISNVKQLISPGTSFFARFMWAGKQSGLFDTSRFELTENDKNKIKQQFNWTDPKLIYVRNNYYNRILIFDADSKGPINNWLDPLMKEDDPFKYKIRGPIIFKVFTDDAQGVYKSINWYKAWFWFLKHEKNYGAENQQKKVDVIHQAEENLVLNHSCPTNKCKTCKKLIENTLKYVENDGEYREGVTEFFDQSKLTDRQYRQKETELRFMTTSCENHGVSWNDFYFTMVRKNLEGEVTGVTKMGLDKKRLKQLDSERWEYEARIVNDKLYNKIKNESDEITKLHFDHASRQNMTAAQHKRLTDFLATVETIL